MNRQLAMVLDLNKCLGCHTCTVACKTLWNKDQGTDYAYWNNVETAPGQGFPRQWQHSGGRDESGNAVRGELPSLDGDYGRAWKFNHNETFFKSNGPRQWLKPEGNPQWGPNWDEDRGEGEYPQDNHYFYLPRLCNHCTHPACLDACPRSAIEKRSDNGIVLVNQDKCHGYRFCVEACPYKKVFFDPKRQVSTKCIFCLPRVEEGVAPACARQCPGRLRFVGFLDDEKGPIHKLVHQYKVAIPLHPEFGTGPNVYYVPPLSPESMDAEGRPTGTPRIPLGYLESLFGPAVHGPLAVLAAEREKKTQGQGSEVMDLLIAFDWSKNFALEDAVTSKQTREVI
jgi:DMSO reductase family type II enzyme iron-sulfur subunit